jgi:hypothetical protein
VVGIGRERLLAGDLRIEKPLGLLMPQSGLIEGSRVRGAGLVRSLAGFPGLSPAFMTVHRRFSWMMVKR